MKKDKPANESSNVQEHTSSDNSGTTSLTPPTGENRQVGLLLKNQRVYDTEADTRSLDYDTTPRRSSPVPWDYETFAHDILGVAAMSSNTGWPHGSWNPRMSMSLSSTKGLLNAPGENNCFLNSAVQVSNSLANF